MDAHLSSGCSQCRKTVDRLRARRRRGAGRGRSTPPRTPRSAARRRCSPRPGSTRQAAQPRPRNDIAAASGRPAGPRQRARAADRRASRAGPVVAPRALRRPATITSICSWNVSRRPDVITLVGQLADRLQAVERHGRRARLVDGAAKSRRATTLQSVRRVSAGVRAEAQPATVRPTSRGRKASRDPTESPDSRRVEPTTSGEHLAEGAPGRDRPSSGGGLAGRATRRGEQNNQLWPIIVLEQSSSWR